MQRQLVVGRTGLVAVLLLAAIVGVGGAIDAPTRATRTLERAPITRPGPTRPARPVTPVPQPASPTTTVAPPAPTTTTLPPPRFTLEPYRGLGAWFDVYDWSTTYARYGPALEVDAVDRLAAQGVQTLFIQASKWDSSTDVVDRARLLAFIDRAHRHRLSVVAWYLPTLEDPGRDITRLLAIARLPVDGLAVDIEARTVRDVAERNRRLVLVSSWVRAALPGEVIGAIPLEPVLLEDVNPGFWPAFPWPQLAASYDVWLPMSYWTNRRGDSPWRDAARYTAANIERLRARIGRPDAPVHALGGVGDGTSVADLQGFRAAAAAAGVIGGSIYDYRTTAGPLWPELAPFRSLRP